MSRIGISLLLIFTTLVAFAQVGNEWIQPSQSYYKIPVAKDGWYRLGFTQLQSAGVPVASLDPRSIQLFHRGEEVSIYVQGENDAVFNETDFVEFFGQKNDGTLDSLLYKPASTQPHKYYNLFNDTTFYFLTFGSAAPGKRISFFDQAANPDALVAESFQYQERLLVLSNQYATGFAIQNVVQNTFFDQGEGWTGTILAQGQSADYTVTSITDGNTGAGLPMLELMLVGRISASHQAQISVGPDVASLRVLTTANFSGYETKKYILPLNWTDIAGNGNLLVRIQAQGVAGQADRLSASYLKVTFPQNTTLANQNERFLSLRENPAGKTFIQLASFPPSTRLFDVTDARAIVEIGTVANTTLNAVIENSQTPRKIFATSVVNQPTIKPVSFRSINPENHDYIIISNRALMKPAATYNNVVEAYASYRASAEGGSYDTLTVTIDQLFDQFSYGETTPLAIYNFMRFFVQQNVPRYLFLIGRGLDVSNGYYRNPSSPVFQVFKDYVPSAGMPGSDLAFTIGLGDVEHHPVVPTGRLTATTPLQVANYLNKVKEHDVRAFDELADKDVLHLTGGIREGEPELFRNLMELIEPALEGYYLGGRVTPIAKQSTDIELINVADKVNKGVNMITFLGHSAPNVTDFQIGYVTDPVMGYNNPGKYPFMLMNGCNVASFFTPDVQQLFGEDWMHADNKGAIGFLSHTSFGYVANLQLYSEMFYEFGFSDSTFFRKGVGEVQLQAAQKFIDINPANIVYFSHGQQMLLLGDPAVKLFGADKPDYEINNQNLFLESFDGQPVTAQADSFKLNAIVRNFGRARQDTILVRISRTLPDNSTENFDTLLVAPLYADTLSFVIRKSRTNGFGANAFTVTLDYLEEFPELREDNNSASEEFFINSNATKNLFPPNFSIVNTTQVNLVVQSTDLLGGGKSVVIEFDTVYSFDSPFKKQFTVTADVIASQAAALETTDSLVYYWRTRLANPAPEESDQWAESSFVYIQNGPEGWAQLEVPQFSTNTLDRLVADPELELISLEGKQTDIFIKNLGASIPHTRADISVKLNNIEYYIPNGYPNNCLENSINLIAFDKDTGIPYLGNFGAPNDPRLCGRSPEVINTYTTLFIDFENATDKRNIFRYIDNVALGDSVILFSVKDAGVAAWSNAVKTKFQELGISIAQLESLQPGEPFVILARKGSSPGEALLIRSQDVPAPTQTLITETTVTGRPTAGTMQSRLIGPAQAWQQFLVQTTPTDSLDQVLFYVHGVDLQGNETFLFNTVNEPVDLSSLSTSDFPYLRVLYEVADSVLLTPAQLNHWIVTYTPVAEGIISFLDTQQQQAVAEGATWTGNYAFTNISTRPFTDSLMVNTEIFTVNQRARARTSFKIKAPLPGEETQFQVPVTTRGKVGLNDVSVFVNPRLQPEQYYDNNAIQLLNHIDVIQEQSGPVLDVKVDGRYLEDGDWVSSRPQIVIQLIDENPFLKIEDTTALTVFLKYPCSAEPCEFTRIDYQRSDVTWTGATDDSPFTFTFNPLLAAGEYTLQVQGQDVTGNTAGLEPYRISFVVADQNQIVISPPYPNPSTDDFSFKVFVSGDDVPQSGLIDIYSFNGTRIGEFETTEPMFTGTNTLRWKGVTGTGQTVPAGMYIYRLVLYLSNGKRIQAVGKMVKQ